MNSQSKEKLNSFGYLETTNIVISNNIVGSASNYAGTNKIYKVLSLSIEENGIDSDLNFEACILSKEILKEIALMCDVLYTDFGFDIHSHTMKTEPFNTLKVIKTRF
jgi:hypothetical protein